MIPSTPSSPSVQPSVPAIVDTNNDNQISGSAAPAQEADKAGQSQVAGNLILTPAPQGDASMGWGPMGQSNVSIPWVAASVQRASGHSMGVEPNAAPNLGWLPNTGNSGTNMVWVSTQGQGTPNAAAMVGGQMQGAAMVPWGACVAAWNAVSYLGWVAQQLIMRNMNQNVGWSGPAWEIRASQSAPNEPRSGGGGSKRQKTKGICYAYRDRGGCHRFDCRYLHPTSTDEYKSRNDQHFNRQHSGKRRRYGNHNEGSVAAGDLTFISTQQVTPIAPTPFAAPALTYALPLPLPAPTDLPPPPPPPVPCDKSTCGQCLAVFGKNPFALDGQETSGTHNEPTEAQSAPSNQDSSQGEGCGGRKRKQSNIASAVEDYVEFKKGQTNKALQALDENRRHEEQFSIEKCLDELDAMDELTNEEKSYAMEVFESVLNREMFIQSKNRSARLIWLKRKMRAPASRHRKLARIRLTPASTNYIIPYFVCETKTDCELYGGICHGRPLYPLKLRVCSDRGLSFAREI